MGLGDWAARKAIKIHIGRLLRDCHMRGELGLPEAPSKIFEDVIITLSREFIDNNKILREEIEKAFDEELHQELYVKIREVATLRYGSSAVLNSEYCS